MNTIQVRFIQNGIMEDNKFDNFVSVKYINDIIVKSAIAMGGYGYLQVINKDVLPPQKDKINELILKDHDESEIIYDESEHEIEVFNGDNQKGQYLGDGFRYSMNFELTSILYTCIQILPDNVFVCYHGANHELKLFKINKTIKAIIFPKDDK